MRKVCIVLLVLLFEFLKVNGQPTITSFSPTSGPAGSTIIIFGTNFDTAPADNIVYFGGLKAEVTAASSVQLSVIVPSGNSYDLITVITSGLIAESAKPFNVTFDGAEFNDNIFGSPITLTADTGPQHVKMLDIDGDGKIDIAVANVTDNTLSIFRNTSSGVGAISFSSRVDYASGQDSWWLETGDLDADGKLDLVVVNGDKTVSIFRNSSVVGAISFDSKIEYPTLLGARSAALGDMDGDGKLDMLIVAAGADSISIYSNTSTGSGSISFGDVQDFKADDPWSIAVTDFDADGKLDFVTGEWPGGYLSVFENTSIGAGDIDFAPPVKYWSETGIQSVTITDVDGDGRQDIIAANYFDDEFSVHLNASAAPGSIDFEAKIAFPTGDSPIAADLSDLDGNGKVDIVTANTGGESVSVYRNTSVDIGSVGYSEKVDYDTGVWPRSVALGDLDGDSKPDLVIANNNVSTIKVFRHILPGSSTENDILSFSFVEKTGDAIVNSGSHTVSVEVAYGTSLTSLVSTFELSPGATAQVGGDFQISGTSVNNFTSPLVYTITAEDGSTQDWTITVTVADPNTEISINSFSFPEQTGTATIDNGNHNIDIEVAYDTNLSSLIAGFLLSDGATALVGVINQESGITSNNFSNPVIYTVTAEDGITTQDWTITVTVADPNTEISVVLFSFPEQTGTATIDNGNHTIDLEVAYDTNLSSLIASFLLSDGATALVGVINQESGITSNNFTNPVTYTVTAEDGITTQDWVVTVIVALSTETDFVSYTFPGQIVESIINVNDHTIEAEVPDGTILTSLVGIFTMSDGANAKVGATVQVSGVTANDFSNPVTYTLSAEDGTTTQDWIVTTTVTVPPSTEADFVSYSFSGQIVESIINLSGHTIEAEVPYGTILTNLVGVFTISDDATSEVGASIQESGITPNDFSNPVTYTITAQDGITTQDWTITVTVADPNTEISITLFSFSEQTGTANIDNANHTIDLEVAYDTNVSSLIASFLLSSGASAKVGDINQQSGITSNNFLNPVTYIVTAEDGTTLQDWIITTSVSEPKTDTNIISFSFPEQTGTATIDNANHTIDLEVAYDTNVSSLIASFLLSDGTTVKIGGINQESGITSNNFSNPVTYTLSAEDDVTTQDWMVTVTITIGPNTETDFVNYSFPEQIVESIINVNDHTIAAEVPDGTILTSLVGIFTMSDGANAKVGATAQVSGVTVNNFSNPVTYTLNAEDGTTTQDWIVTVTVGPSTETDFVSYSFLEQIGESIINVNDHTIDVEVPYGTILTSLVGTFTISDGANAKVAATDQVNGVTANNFSSPVTYTVTAEDESTAQDWTITLTESDPSTETSIISFSFLEQTGAATIDNGNHTIGLELAYDTNLTSLVASFLLSDGATAKVGGINQESSITPNNFSNPVTYTLSAEDGTTTQDWVVTVTVGPSTETDFVGYSFPGQIDESIINVNDHTIEAEVPHGTILTSLVGTFTISEGANTKVGANDQVSGVTANSFTNPLTYKVTAEDGLTLQDWLVTVAVSPDITDPVIDDISAFDSYLIGSGGLILSAAVSDDSNLSKVNVYFRKVANSEFSVKEMNLEEDRYSYSFDDTNFDELGLIFFIEAIDETGNRSSSNEQHVITETSGNVHVISEPVSSNDQLDYAIIAIPYESQKVADVFSNLGQFNSEEWRLAHFEGEKNYQFYPRDFDIFEPGRGYWFLTSRPEFTLKGGKAVRASFDTPFSIQLKSEEWNMIGNPYPFTIDWEVVIDHNANNGITIEKLVFFKNKGFSTSQTSLSKYEGALLYSSESVNLEIPITANVNAGARKSFGYKNQANQDFENGNWEFAIGLANETMRYNISSIGMREGASIGKDLYDWNLLPRLSSFLDISFDQGITTSIVPNQQEFVWEFEVNSNSKGESTVLNWDNIALGKSKYRMMLLDLQSQIFTDMVQVNEYRFDMDKQHRSFKLYYANIDRISDLTIPKTSNLGDPFPNPFSGDVKVPVVIGDEGSNVVIKVYNILGQELYHKSHQGLASGYYEFDLDFIEGFRDLSGITYIVRVDIKSVHGFNQYSKKIVHSAYLNR